MEFPHATVTDMTPDTMRVRESALLRAAANGDRNAYREIYDTHINRVYGLCFRLTGERGMAEDAAQEVFIQVWRTLSNFDERSQFSTWLHSVAANVTISYMRRQKNWLQRMFDIESVTLAEPGTSGCSSEVDLEKYILRLPERARVVFVLHAVEGYRHEDIATMLKIASGTSKAQYHRARQLLEDWMGAD